MSMFVLLLRKFLTIPNGQSETGKKNSQYNEQEQKGKRTNDGL